MFGDLFSQRTDNQKGMMYSSRRKFLVSAGKNVLEPPVEFKTRKQSKRIVDEESLHGLHDAIGTELRRSMHDVNKVFNMSSIVQSTKRSFLSKYKNGKTQQKRSDRLIIDKFSDYDMSHWTQQNEAGCLLWVNKFTGEVSGQCPWQHFDIEPKNKENELKKDVIIDEGSGTGSLVYDSSDLLELFDILDNSPTKK